MNKKTYNEIIPKEIELNRKEMKINLIILPMHDWKKCEKAGFRTRDAHLIQHFEKNKNIEKILIVDRPTTLPEMILKKRYWKVKSGKTIRRTLFTSLTQVSEKIFVLDIFAMDLFKPLILKRDWWDYIFRKEKIIQEINKAIAFLNFKNRVLFLWTPLSTGVIGKIGEDIIVFDADDNWLKHPEINDKRGWIKRGYETIKEKADIIFTNSKETQKLMQNPRVPPILVPNGVDKEFFQIKHLEIPDDLKNIPHPIIGYSGTLAKRIDVELLSFLARKLSKVSFVLIGQVLDKRWIKPLFKLNNIYYLGDKHYSRLPNYIANFDICIIPHNVGKLECDGDPIKLYEYLAAGKPVVSTPILGVDVFKDIITIAQTKEEFLEGLIYWLEKIKEDKYLPERLKNSISDEHTWGKKADLMVSIICNKLLQRHT